MTDEIKTDAQKVLTDGESIARTGLSTAEGYVKTHMVWVAGIIGLLMGFIAGKIV